MELGDLGTLGMILTALGVICTAVFTYLGVRAKNKAQEPITAIAGFKELTTAVTARNESLSREIDRLKQENEVQRDEIERLLDRQEELLDVIRGLSIRD